MDRSRVGFGGSPILGSAQRFVLGIVVLILVDIIWVMSSELTEYIFKNEKFDKPFFSTYVKTSMFLIFLSGFIFYTPWHDRCRKSQPSQYSLITSQADSSSDDVVDDTVDAPLSPPMYVPVNCDGNNSGNESEDSLHRRSVRFNKVAEVRHLAEAEAADAMYARLSYQATVQAEQQAYRLANRLTPKETAKLALTFCLLWFLANYTYQVALSNTQVGVVNVLSSASGLFTLILASSFPSVPGDKFTASKFLAVLVNLFGVAIVCWSATTMETKKFPLGTIFALVSAFFYASYLVFLRKKVDHEDKLDIPMFFGFVGLFNLLMLWPLFFLLHHYEVEEFSWPSKRQWLLLVCNGIIGTVFSEVLWLWGCFLTSSLVATLAINLTIPLSMMGDVLFKSISYDLRFYLGTVPMVFAFVAVNMLTFYDNWNPVADFFRAAVMNRPTRNYHRVRINDDPQNESLISVDGVLDDDDEEEEYSAPQPGTSYTDRTITHAQEADHRA